MDYNLPNGSTIQFAGEAPIAIKGTTIHLPKQIKKQVMIHKSLLMFSNPFPSKDLIEKIAAEFDPAKFGAVPVFRRKNGFLMTDGNHRTRAAMRRGVTWIPCVLLNKKEFDTIKFSSKTIDFTIIVPVEPRYIRHV